MHKEQIMIVLDHSDALEMKKKFPNRFIVEVDKKTIIQLSASNVYFSEKLNEHGKKGHREKALEMAVSFLAVRPKEKNEKLVEGRDKELQDLLVVLKSGEKIKLRNTTEIEVSGGNLLISDKIGVVLTVVKNEVLYIWRAR